MSLIILLKWIEVPTLPVVITLFISVLGIIWWFTKIRNKCLPPGPMPLPIVGNFHQMAFGGVNNLQWTLMEWGKQFGKMYTIYMGGDRCVVLNSFDVIKEAFSLQVFSGRPNNFISEELGEHMGILFTGGSAWKDQRRFTLSQLRDLGIGKISFEDKILNEINLMFEDLEQENGKPYDMQYLLTNSVANIISSVLWGKRYEQNDEHFQGFLHTINQNILAVNNTAVLDKVVPFLRYLPGDLTGFKLLMGNKVIIESYIQGIIDEHKETFDSDNLRDFTDVYLAQIEKEKSTKDTSFTEKQLLKILGELLVAGLETTSTTLRWAILYLTLNPEVQSKARQEVDDVIGHSRLPSMRDRANLPYIEAVLMEAHRLGRVVTTGVPHVALKDVNFRDYVIPEGTTIIPNMTAVFLNEKEFKDPMKFAPERYLDDEGNFVRSSAEHVIPFSIGRRMCLGESLARMELFLFLTAMIQRFTFSLPEGAPPPSVKGQQGFTYLPQPHHLCALTRK